MKSPNIKLNNGVEMPIIGLGTWMMGGQEAESAAYNAIKIGYRHIDTAKYYGNETEIGNAIRKAIKDFKLKREDIFVTTKLWNSDQSNPAKAFNESLKRLDIEYIDLYLIHWPMSGRIKAWTKLQPLIKSGKVKSLGVSNFSIEQLKEIDELKLPKPSVNQVEFSPYLYQKDLLEYCNKNGIALVAYSPLTRAKKLSDNILKNISKKYNKSPAQILLKWGIQHNIAVIPKSSNFERIKENFDVFDFEIKKEDMGRLDSLNQNFYSFISYGLVMIVLKIANFFSFKN